MYIQRKRWRMSRRTFLQAAGVSLALPWLEAMGLRSGSVTNAGEMAAAEIPRRAYFSVWGFFNNRAVPKETGKDYPLPAPFEVLKDYKNDFTLFSGLRVADGSHSGPGAFLTGTNGPRNSFRLISVDQQIAAFHKGKTRAALAGARPAAIDRFRRTVLDGDFLDGQRHADRCRGPARGGLRSTVPRRTIRKPAPPRRTNSIATPAFSTR